MGFFSGGGTTSTSESFSGLRGTDQFKPLSERLGSGFQFGMDTARQRVGELNPLGLGANGLTDAQNLAFNTLGKNLFSNVSGSYANRGFLSPESVSGVIGSSLTQAAPQLMNQVFQNQMGQQSVLSDRFGALRSLLDTGTGLAGSQTKSHSQTKGPNILAQAVSGWASPQGLGSFMSGMGDLVKGASTAGAMCWVADALYGKHDLRAHVARWYVTNVLPTTIAGRLFVAVYRKVGRKVASLIPRYPVMRTVLMPLFDRFVYNGAHLLSR